VRCSHALAWPSWVETRFQVLRTDTSDAGRQAAKLC